MFDHIAFGPFAENPAGKGAIPFFIAWLIYHQLHKSTRFRIGFPRRSLFASLQADNGIADSLLLARLHGQ